MHFPLFFLPSVKKIIIFAVSIATRKTRVLIGSISSGNEDSVWACRSYFRTIKALALSGFVESGKFKHTADKD